MKVFIDEITVDGKKREIYLESDDLQYTLKEYYTVEKGENAGKEASQLIGYYPSILSSLKKVLTIKIKESKATDVRELIEDIYRIEQQLFQVFSVKLADGERVAV